MANIYSNMTQKQKDNEKAYLTNLQNSGTSGEKEWATNQLKQLNSTTSSSSSSSSTPSYNQTWESNGRTYVGGVDVGAAGTQSDTSKTTSMINAAIAANNSGSNKGSSSSYNPYEEAYKEALNKYNDLNDQIAEQNRLAVEQGTQRLEAQKESVNQAAEDNARQAYIMQMQAKKALPQQLAGQGATGGTTETANLGIQTAYQNSLNDINKNKVNAIQEIDNAIADLKTTGNLAAVEQVLANNQQALNAYMNMLDKNVSYNQWAAQYNANRADTAYEQGYQERAYQDALKQQAFENELALQANNLKKTTQTSGSTTNSNTGVTDNLMPLADISNYINNQMGGDFIEYNKDLKKYAVGSWTNTKQKEQIVKTVAKGIEDGTLGDDALDALINLGYSLNEIKAIVDQM